jgi:hypothetical protein
VGALASVLLSFYYVRGLRTFLAFGNFELYLVSFLKALVTLCGDRAVVHKHIWSICATDEPVPFCVVEPLHYAFHPIHEMPLFCTSSIRGPRTCPQSLDAFWDE